MEIKISYTQAISNYNNKLKDGYHFIAVCKKTGKEFLDYANKSGSLITYIQENYDSISIPSTYIRREHFITHNKFWHENFFHIIQKKIVEKINTDERDAKIVNLYVNKEVTSTHKLGAMFNLGHKKVREILKNHNITLNKRGRQVKWSNLDTDIIKKTDYRLQESNKIKIAICKLTDKKFNDYANKSGALTEHIKRLYPTIEIPSAFIQSKILASTNRFWHEDYFDLIEVDQVPTRKCQYCDWETTDVDNKTGCFERHIVDAHNLTLKEHFLKYPDDSVLHNVEVNRLKHLELLQNEDNFVVCQICNEKFMTINQVHLNKHNITVEEYKKKFGGEIISKNTLEIFKKNLDNGRIMVKNNYISKPQLAIYNFLIENGVECKLNDKQLLRGIEIDILIPALKLGIEFNGNLWHSEMFGKKGMNYHLNKTTMMNSVGYGLIHIFEDEWVYNQNLVLDKISNVLLINKKPIIGARKCMVQEIDSQTKNKFLIENHIQGTDKSNIKLGAFYNNELVGVMTFNSNRNMTQGLGDNEWELSRFATNNKYRCVGLGSKLLKYFINTIKPHKIFSFADRRWTMNKENNLYTKMGFSLIRTTKPNYYYLNFKETRIKRLHKYGFGKKKLIKKYNAESSKTEWEIMKELGYDRIWDCGLFKYGLDLNHKKI